MTQLWRAAHGRRAAAFAAAGALVATTAAAAAAPSGAVAASTDWLSRPHAPALSTTVANAGPARFSADGGLAVFAAAAPNLVPELEGSAATPVQVYVRDTSSGATRLVSRAAGADGAIADAASNRGNATGAGDVAISADGSVVAFESRATNLVAGAGSVGQIYVRELAGGTVERVSAANDGAPADAWTSDPSLSANGRYVAFVSGASNLPGADSDGDRLLYVRDRQNGTTAVASLAADGTTPVRVGAAQISADGRAVVFTSNEQVVAGVDPGYDVAYRRVLATGAVTAVSVAADGAPVEVSGDLFASADARYVAWATRTATTVDERDAVGVFRRDLQAGATARVSVADDGSLPDAVAPVVLGISADGRRVAFSSRATNLVAGDTNGVNDTFVRDLVDGTTVRATLRQDGGQIDRASYGATANPTINDGALSPDGRWVSFSTNAGEVVPDGPAAVSPTTGARRYHGYARDIGAAVVPGTVETGVATGVGSDRATVRGVADPGSRDATVTVEYGTTDAYGSESAPLALAGGSGARTVAVALSGLGAATSYHYRLVLRSGDDAPVRGADRVLTTAAAGADGATAIVGGSASWGFAAALRGMFEVDPPNNFNTSFPGDPDQVFWYPYDGAERVAGVPQWRFAASGGSYDAAGGKATIRFGGGLRIGYCVGGFRPGPEPIACPTSTTPPAGSAFGVYVGFSDLELSVDGTSGTLSGLSYAGMHGQAPVALERRAFATLDLAAVTPVRDDAARTVTWTAVPVTLSQAGAPLGLGVFPAGTQLDPIDVTATLAEAPVDPGDPDDPGTPVDPGRPGDPGTPVDPGPGTPSDPGVKPGDGGDGGAKPKPKPAVKALVGRIAQRGAGGKLVVARLSRAPGRAGKTVRVRLLRGGKAVASGTLAGRRLRLTVAKRTVVVRRGGKATRRTVRPRLKGRYTLRALGRGAGFTRVVVTLR